MSKPKSSLNYKLIEAGSDFVRSIHNETYPAIHPMTKSNYAGHTVFISGASEGVGRATAISFAKASATEFALSAQSDISSLESEIQSTAKNAGKKSPQVLKLKLDVTDQTFVEPQQRLPRKSSGSWIF